MQGQIKTFQKVYPFFNSKFLIQIQNFKFCRVGYKHIKKRISSFESGVEFFRSPNNFFNFAKIIELLNLFPVFYNSLMGSEQEGVVKWRTFWSCFFWKRAEFLPEFRNFVDDIAAVRVNCKLNELSATARNTKPLQQMHSDQPVFRNTEVQIQNTITNTNIEIQSHRSRCTQTN